jgi:hypothetical protein
VRQAQSAAASVDFPGLAGPAISTARPSIVTVEAWNSSKARPASVKGARSPLRVRMSQRDPVVANPAAICAACLQRQRFNPGDSDIGEPWRVIKLAKAGQRWGSGRSA